LGQKSCRPDRVKVAKNPMMKEPVTLMTNVPQGKVSPMSRDTTPVNQ
jgi:hypothetical protein